jgi:type I restriction enzyme S subunit
MEIRDLPFADLLAAVVDNRGRTCPTAERGIPLIATNCVRNDFLFPTYEKARFVSEDTYREWFRGHPLPGDILFVNKATPGRVCLVPDPVDFCIAQDMVAVRADDTKVYPPYLFAALRSPVVQDRIKTMHVGTLIPHFKKGDFAKLLVPVPNPGNQKFIGDIYLSLSRKIELNRRMNETLEEMARALFKSWFVDFDPVRRKAEGRDPGLPKHLADLFPSRFVDSELGEIPEGWELKSLDRIANFKNGLALQRFRPVEGEDRLPVVKIADLRTGEANQNEWAHADIEPGCIIDDGDIVFSWSGSLTVVVWCGGRAALNQHLFRVTSESTPRSIVLGWLLHHLPSFQQIASDKATTMGHIQRHHLADAKCACPPPRTLAAAATHLEELLARTIAAELQARTLRRCRDALLPKLISGELRIDDADDFLAGVPT